MLLVSDYNTINYAYNLLTIKNRNISVVNLSSANLSIKPSTLFYVPQSSMETADYDVEYANFIFAHTEQRIEFLMLIHTLQNGGDVLISIGNYPGMYEMAESLLRFIRYKYGYVGYIISMNDLEYLDMFESRFTAPGLLTFDQEKVELDEIFLSYEQGIPWK